jgi:hypothetical protein
MTINTEIVKNLTATSTVRRCNNTLRWIDEPTGAIYTEPCIIEYEVKEAREHATQGSPFMTPGGFLKIYTQFNPQTSKINQNQRFLFGNKDHWTCYKVVGTGINDFRNATTYDNTKAQILVLDLIANFTNDELDDFVNRIEEVHSNVYAVTLNKSTAEGAPAGTIQLLANVSDYENNVTSQITWTTSDKNIATVSESGLVTLVATGSCIITANVTGNPASASALITVTNTPAVNNEIRISPDKNYVLEGSQQNYSVYLYQDDVQQANSFTFTCNPNGVPSTNYVFTVVDGNNFRISNSLRDLYSYLTIHCVSGSASQYVKDFDIYLRGAWLYDTI